MEYIRGFVKLAVIVIVWYSRHNLIAHIHTKHSFRSISIDKVVTELKTVLLVTAGIPTKPSKGAEFGFLGGAFNFSATRIRSQKAHLIITFD